MTHADLRSLTLATALLLGACSAPSGTPQAQPTAATATQAATQAARPKPPTADALAARDVAQRYLDLVRKRDFAQAYGLWSAGTAGPLDKFVASYRAYVRYDGQATAPTDIHTTGGMDFVLVEATAETVIGKDDPVERYGVVMLRRPTGSGQPWRIWGIDIRERHCGSGKKGTGRDCV